MIADSKNRGGVFMPNRNGRSKGHQNKSTALNRKMLDNTGTLCKSQVYNEIYDKLHRDCRLSRFVAVVQYCSMSGLDIKDSVDTIIKSFPSYIDEKEFTVDCFRDMISNYSDIAVAWGYGELGDEISQIIVKNKALQLVERTDKMEDIEIYNTLYGKSDTSVADSKTVINFNLNKKE